MINMRISPEPEPKAPALTEFQGQMLHCTFSTLSIASVCSLRCLSAVEGFDVVRGLSSMTNRNRRYTNH